MIFTVFRKELKDTLRDRRTLMMMIVIPVLIFPVILNVFVGISASFQESAANKTLKIGYVVPEGNIALKDLQDLPSLYGKKELVAYADTNSLIADIRKDSIQLGLFAPAGFNEAVQTRSTAHMRFYYDATDIGMQERAKTYAQTIEEKNRVKRFQELNIDLSQVTPVETSYANVASDKEMIGKLAGGFLPYIFIAFGFLGCMYPAIDLFTGEKERGTMETLLTTPVARWKLLFGKMGVIVLSGLMASTCALLGLYLSIEVLHVVENEELLAIIHSILSVKFILMLYGLLIPLVIFFSGVMIPISIYAKTFKEAQSIITPLNIVMVLPAMVGFFPGIELNAVTACIPVVNIVLSTKELIAGTLDPSLLLLSFGIMLLLAVAAVFVSYKRFDNEQNVVS